MRSIRFLCGTSRGPLLIAFLGLVISTRPHVLIGTVVAVAGMAAELGTVVAAPGMVVAEPRMAGLAWRSGREAVAGVGRWDLGLLLARGVFIGCRRSCSADMYYPPPPGLSTTGIYRHLRICRARFSVSASRRAAFAGGVRPDGIGRAAPL